MKFPGSEKMFLLLKRNSRLIFISIIAGLVIGILYSLFIFKPVYKSEATLLINNSDNILRQTSYSEKVDKEKTKFIHTHLKLLSLDQLAQKTWKELKSKYKLSLDDKNGLRRVKSSIKLNNPENTDIITLTAYWNNPEIVQDLANISALAYMELNGDINKNAISGELQAVKKKIEQTQKELLAVRTKIKEFQKANSSIDFTQEIESLNERIMKLEDKKQELKLVAATEIYKITSISRNLGLEEENIKNMASAGFNRSFTNLVSKLDELQDELAGLSTKYTELHPNIKDIKSRIERVESQIQEQIKLSFGNNIKTSNSLVLDPVKAGMAEVLVSSKEKYNGLNNQIQNVTKLLNDLKQKRAEIPEQQFVLTSYKHQEEALESIINNLKTREAGLEVIAAGRPGNVNIVDFSTIPISASFPGKFQVVLLFTIFFGMLASIIVLLKDFLKNSYSNIEAVERDLNTPVLGVIPWLDKDLYEEPEIMFTLDESTSFYSLAYQKAVLGIRIKGDASGKKALAFTSSESSKNKSTIIMNLAYSLSRTGQSAIVVDADFRTPSIGKEFGFETSSKYSLAELLGVIRKDLQDGNDFNSEKINLCVRSIPNVENFSIIPNSGNIPDPAEYLYSDAFDCLIKKLKEKYNWVFVDVPPAIAVPDAFIAGRYVDGIVLITGLDTNKSILRKVYRQFENYNINVFGVIAREYQTREVIFSGKYIRQMLSRLIPQSEDAIT